MTRDYEGKLGIGQMFFCILALATLFVPFALSTMTFAVSSFDNIATAQSNYLTAFVQLLSFSITLPSAISYVIYLFYGIVGITFLFTLIMMFMKNELVRQTLRLISVIIGFVMIAIFLINLLTVAGFFTFYMNGGFGNELIVDCITEKGLLFFLALTFMSAIGMIKYFSSFFGKSY